MEVALLFSLVIGLLILGGIAGIWGPLTVSYLMSFKIAQIIKLVSNVNKLISLILKFFLRLN